MPLLPREELVPYKHCKNLTELLVGSIQQPWHQRTNLCPHSDEERKMTGTWCTEELKMAVQKSYKMMVLGALPNCRKQWKKGYKIQKIHKVWHCGENQRKTGLFAPYVNRWLKHKTEASGWPAHCLTEDQKAAYIRDYKEHEGIQL